MRILIIEDEVRLAGTLADMVGEDNYTADVAHDGESGLDSALSDIYDAIVLDVMLPKLDGFEVLKRLRQAGIHTPVLMLTAKSDLIDRVHGLDLGADYYLTKPFENAEFLACLRAILRRQGDITPERIVYGDLTLTPSMGALRCGERALTLSARELEIMRLLMLNHNTILPKETLLVKVWGYDSDAGDNNVEAYISFIRKKLSLLRSTVTLNVVRRLGYRLEESKP
ncbi:MAG TPA: response regulator transcription factor [Candidatus Limiplasma sp.]|nr:response regulator transcription factor [Candidatus Limiplasma sp.]HPS82057.1 response regulator transcription factor [Candidatus Limiplasma sp.]